MRMIRRKAIDAKPVVPTEPENKLAQIVDISPNDVSVANSALKLPFLSGLYNLGFQRATDAGITELTEDFLAPLSEHARAVARDNASVKFSPDEHLHDKLEFDEYKRALKARDNACIGEDHAIARLREAKKQLDATKRVGESPKLPSLLLMMCVAMIAISLSNTIHDRLIPAGVETVLSIVLSLILGSLLGAAPVHAIFHGRNSTKRWIGIITGVLLGVGLFAVRVSGAESSGEVLYAAGWAALELAGILLAEYLSQAHRKAEVEWEHDHHTEVAAVAAVGSAKEDVYLWRDRISAAQSELDRISGIVHKRNSRALRVEDIELLCVKAVRDGASSGVAQNLGIIRGLKRPPQPQLPSKGQVQEAK
jgi:hypothetical protein